MKNDLCYNDNHIDNDYNDNLIDECELCDVIDYVVKSITPECDCFIQDRGPFFRHEVTCHYAAFVYSQIGRG